jgi:hypothetical protein
MLYLPIRVRLPCNAGRFSLSDRSAEALKLEPGQEAPFRLLLELLNLVNRLADIFRQKVDFFSLTIGSLRAPKGRGSLSPVDQQG